MQLLSFTCQNKIIQWTRRRYLYFLTLGISVPILYYVCTHNPHTTVIMLCPFHLVTGLWCPFCGSLRWIYDVTHGDFRMALHDNTIFPFLCGYSVVWFCVRLHKKISTKAALSLDLILYILLLSWTIIRNLPIFPFKPL